jgi:hypothetical protein
VLTSGELTEFVDVGGFADVLEKENTITSIMFYLDMLLL